MKTHLIYTETTQNANPDQLEQRLPRGSSDGARGTDPACVPPSGDERAANLFQSSQLGGNMVSKNKTNSSAPYPLRSILP